MSWRNRKVKPPQILMELREANGPKPGQSGREWSKARLADPVFLRRFSLELEQLTGIPKNRMIMDLLKEKFPGFDYTIVANEARRAHSADNWHTVTYSNYPEIDVRGGQPFHPTFADLLLIDPCEVRVGSRPHGERLWRQQLGNVGAAIARTLHDGGFVSPSDEVVTQVSNVIKSARRDEVTIFGAFCPDYSFEDTGVAGNRYRYTFTDVGSGIGLVAQRMSSMVQELHSCLSSQGIRHRFVLGIGDFEANEVATLERVQVSREVFLQRCQASATAMQTHLREQGVPVVTEMLYARFGSGFDAVSAEALDQMQKGRDFGMMSAVLTSDPEEHIARTARKYLPFYERWYGRMDEEKARRAILSQGAQYAALGFLQRQRFGKHCFQIAADRPEMQAFGSLFGVMPTLSAKRYY